MLGKWLLFLLLMAIFLLDITPLFHLRVWFFKSLSKNARTALLIANLLFLLFLLWDQLTPIITLPPPRSFRPCSPAGGQGALYHMI